ncbi:NAD-dependent protein deacylase [Aminipila butyrica]|uniref:NAD-dependent protein deacetylase n=1 Tax=Aminipila butyrica TaxID=433296 RepID=A0A858BXE3_9FIRM|nr:NAD-dependent protein deacylase [Aminipila butyrica]QIB70623.1 NAD-dependent protein deacylase [Aminipila butyrica]
MNQEIQQLSQIIQDSQNIVFFGGAGVSTESNIPDFRSESGLYQAVSQYGHPPETMLSRSFFDGHLDTFYDYYKNNLIYTEAKPNDAHLALARLEAAGKLKAVVTQNIDGLHQLAGSKTVFELHGSVLRNNCMACGAPYDLAYIMDPAHCKDNPEEKRQIPLCEKCGGIVKPDVVLYEECLNDQVMEGAISAIAQADTLIVGGTSLVVYPAAGLINYFHGNHLVLINKSETSYDRKADLVIYDAIGKVLREATKKYSFI